MFLSTQTLQAVYQYPILGYSRTGYILGGIKSDPRHMAKKLTQEKLIAALVKLRKEAGLTQLQLASKLDRPQSYVSKYENGERTLNFIEVIEVFDALDADAPAQLEALRR